jgi:hypothetical protein
MKKSFEEFKNLPLMEKVIIITALAGSIGYLINAVKR